MIEKMCFFNKIVLQTPQKKVMGKRKKTWVKTVPVCLYFIQRRKDNEDVCNITHITEQYKLTSRGLAGEWIERLFLKK